MNLSFSSNLPIRNHLIIILVTLLWSSYLFVFSEWLFFATKPSFTNIWSLAENLSALLLAPMPLFFIGLICLLPVIILTYFWPRSRPAKFAVVLSTIIPSIILCGFIFLLVENFTYTVWGFNVGSFQRVGRYVYSIAVVVCIVWLCRVIWQWGLKLSGERSYRFYTAVIISLLVASAVIGLGKYLLSETPSYEGLKEVTGKLPNILILSSDGLNARKMSAYGYERDTTPFITSLIDDSLVVENHFTNNAKSTGSIGALFSGKLPTKTRVIYPPDIFRGVDAYQHIPGLLKMMGYRNADISIRHYADPYDLNIREGFDYANGRSISTTENTLGLSNDFVKLFSNEAYFLQNSVSRITSRFKHALSISDMVNPYDLVTSSDGADRNFSDESRMEQLFEFIEASETPFFAHVHLMGTHGPKFSTKVQNFSLGTQQTGTWMTDFYDDAVLNFDHIVENAVAWLKSKSLYDETLLILTSDHGAYWLAVERVPLIMHFPKEQFTGLRRNNVQRVDLSATLLDYLGVAVPDWVDGESFLHGELNHNRPIYYVDSAQWGSMDDDGWRTVEEYQEPYYSLGGVGMIVGQNWYFLNPSEDRLLSGNIKSHALHLENENLPTTEDAHQQLINHLIEHDYPAPLSTED